MPELAQSLTDLDTKTRINDAYRAALSKARTMGEVYLANQLRGEALAANSLNSATIDPTNYLTSVLASGKSQQHLFGMQGDFAKKLASMFASAPDAVRSATQINSGFRTFERQAELFDQAVKKYGSFEAARKRVAPPGSSQHNAGNAADLGFSTDQAREWFHANAGRFGLQFPMGHEPWHIEDAGAGATARDEAFRRNYEQTLKQTEAYRQITEGARSFRQEQEFERSALDMTAVQAQKLRFEQQLLNEAQRAGIELTPAQRREIGQLAQGMAEAQQTVAYYAESQRQLSEATHFFGEQAVDALLRP